MLQNLTTRLAAGVVASDHPNFEPHLSSARTISRSLMGSLSAASYVTRSCEGSPPSNHCRLQLAPVAHSTSSDSVCSHFALNTACKMSAIPLCRAALRRNALPLGVGLTSGFVLLHRQQPMRLDAIAANPSANHRQFSVSSSQRKDRLNPEVIKQLSGGSLAGEMEQDLLWTTQ